MAGGLQPRAAVGYMTVAALEVAALCGAGRGCDAEIDVAAEPPRGARRGVGPGRRRGRREAKMLARGLHGDDPGRSPAPGLTAPVAYRWKTQINENAKMPAFSSELPELDHNEIVRLGGRRGARAASRRCSSTTPTSIRACAQRIELTRGPDPRAGAHATVVVRRAGRRGWSGCSSLVLLGDLVSLYLAVLRGRRSDAGGRRSRR